MSRNVDRSGSVRRARRAQWLADAAALYEVHLAAFYGYGPTADEIGQRRQAAKAVRRERRLARRRADRRAHDADALMLHAEDVRRRAP